MGVEISLEIKKHKQEGNLAHEYQPLYNIINEDGKISDFNTDKLNIDLNHPLNMECQPSYDGTVNLIINDDKNPPRIVNTRFSKLEDNRYKIINRNQLKQTNLYEENNIDLQTRLFRNIEHIPRIDLMEVNNNGHLLGGNYTFYIKLADNDYNKTDIAAESGQVSIFKGTIYNVRSISGTLLNEVTDKGIILRVSNVDTSFSKIYVYYTREFCDLNGVKLSESKFITTPYDIEGDSFNISINGFEKAEDISVDDLNIKYNLVTAVKTQTQVQNMLFFGNVQGVVLNIKELQKLSYLVRVTLRQGEDIGWIEQNNYSIKDGISEHAEYYSPLNIYYKLGYWPDELYRLGIVYIMKDDSLSPVFNLRGAEISVGESNIENSDIPSEYEKDLPNNEILTDCNTFGVFINTIKKSNNNHWTIINYDSKEVKPLYYEIKLDHFTLGKLKELGVKGYFIVRQKRIPTVLCQGFSVGIDRSSYVPMLYDTDKKEYFTESFLNSSKTLTSTSSPHKVYTGEKQCSGLLSVDALLVPELQSLFDGSNFIIQNYSYSNTLSSNKRHFWANQNGVDDYYYKKTNIIYIDSDTPVKYVNGFSYSTKCGSQEDVSQFSFFDKRDYDKDNTKLLRGTYSAFLGLSDDLRYNNSIYNIRIPNYSVLSKKEYIKIRGADTSPFFAISDRYEIGDNDNVINVYRGDCYINTVSIRLNKNFVDSEVPISEVILDPNTWRKHYKGYLSMKEDTSKEPKKASDNNTSNWSEINRADVNTVGLGMWITYKCLSNYNLGLRSEDRSHSDEIALMGHKRSYYPLDGMSIRTPTKIEESHLLNLGYSSTLGCRYNFTMTDTPYIKELFDNRIMFSNVQRDDDFKNSYRVFQGLSFKDIDRQYGAIVKMLPWGNDLLGIFEHGIGIIPVNQKALMHTTTGQEIHMYGAGVLQSQISLISGDYGTIWPESIIKTPIGVYGVDTYAKKIWRCSQQKGIETISDMKVQRFLNDNIKLAEEDKYPIIGLLNVKSHYNNYKGDIMFTFYNYHEDKTWNLCFNERMNKWVTRYSWTPLYSENINNIFYSTDQNRAKILSYIYRNRNCTYGISLPTNGNIWKNISDESVFRTPLRFVGNELANKFEYTINNIETSYVDSEGNEVVFNIKDELFYIQNDNIVSKPYKEFVEYFDNIVPIYYILHMSCTPFLEKDDQPNARFRTYNDSVCIILDDNDSDQNDIFLRNGVYVHGRSGIFNEINYENKRFDDQILPTKWYNRQEPFEFEFVVNGELGMHKIFDNLVIISNNVQPNEIEYEIEGDVFNFNKSGIFRSKHFDEDEWKSCKEKKFWTKSGRRVNDNLPTDTGGTLKKYKTSQELINCDVKWDTVLNSYTLVLKQECKNIYDWGRRLGNIQYKEDSWYITIDPILFKEKVKINNGEVLEEATKYNKIKEARLRDKYIKIRVKYTGEDAVIITALKTLTTLSYA